MPAGMREVSPIRRRRWAGAVRQDGDERADAIIGGTLAPEVKLDGSRRVIQVKIDPDSDRSTDTRYSMTSYFLKQGRYLGSRRGTWMNDGAGTGTCVVVFDTEPHAKDAIDPLTPDRRSAHRCVLP
jgi:hypothetical protein